MLDQQHLSANTSEVQPQTPNSARRQFIRWTGLLIASFLVLVLTSPRSVPSLLLIVGFIALGGILYAILQIVLAVSGIHSHLSAAARRSIVMLVVVLPVLLVIMQSIGQLSVRDVLTLGSLFAIGVFYVARARK